MPRDPHLADLMRQALADRPGVREQAMFGGYCWMLNGNMLCGVEVGRFMFRVGKTQEAEALARPGCQKVVFSGRPMGGIVWVDADACLDAGIETWIALAAGYVGELPPKQKS
jgi:TfoX/Sxy family transcriptional regulator of competence genes